MDFTFLIMEFLIELRENALHDCNALKINKTDANKVTNFILNIFYFIFILFYIIFFIIIIIF